MAFGPVDPKPDFVKKEEELLKNWYSRGIVKKYLAKNRDAAKKFSFLDGPITANNPMGVHHAWGRTYKDLWQRFYNMKGFAQRFQNGFDEQGLWVEVEVEKELGLKNKKDIENLVPGDKFSSIAKFVNLCKERVKKYSKIQTEQSKRLGYFMDWDNSYHTSADVNNYAIWHYLAKVFEKGWLYKGRDSVPWCPRCGTAISQHEILTEEYQEITHVAVFVKYSVLNEEYTLLVWTTTPWTLISNVAIAINPELDYGIWKADGNLIVIEKTRAFKIGILGKPVKIFKGRQLVGKKYSGIFDDFAALAGVEHKIIASGDLVTAEEGTGLVHIAPGAGEEDFDLAQKENLPVIASIDETAAYIQGFGGFSGKNAKENPDLVIDELRKRKALFKVENYTHRYPVCWRCKTELVWRVVDEWYIAMDKKDPKLGKTYRYLMKQIIKNINWIPKWGYERELDWLNNMDDWLISKKRYWGLALPIWECENCGNFDVISSAEELKKRAVLGWSKFDGNTPHRPWIDEVKIKCSKCNKVMSRIPDVANPWLDAGIVPFSTMPSEWFPADFIVESFPGQFKNWFYSLIAMSTALKYTTPFKNLLGHGQVRDEKGEEMHKSKGNAIEFEEAARKIGVDVMRWLYLGTKPEHNVNFGYHAADEIRRLFILPLWNVYVFFTTYALIDKWKPQKTKFIPTNVLDRWILSRLNGSIENINKALDGLNTHRFDAADAVGLAEIFIKDLSNWYVRRVRDRVGPQAPQGKDKNDAYFTLWEVLTTFSKVLAPVVPFISETIYKGLTDKESVHLTNWPEVNRALIDKKLEKEMEEARKVVELTHAERKAAGIKVRQPLLSLATTTPVVLTNQVSQVIADEVNVKKVTNEKNSKTSIKLDLTITSELKAEGVARELVRKIQEERKRLGCSLTEKVNLILPSWPAGFQDYIMRQTLTAKITKGPTLKVVRTS